MHREDELLHMHLLGNNNLSSTESQGLYKVLLNYLQGDDFKAFKNLFDKSKDKYEETIDINYNNDIDGIGMTYLDIACKNDQANFVAYLLERGADPNKINKSHNCGPIHFATKNGHIDVLTVLLDQTNINPNLESSGQMTALHLAVKRNDLDSAELLLDKGAQPNIPNNKGLTPIHLAAMKGQECMVKLIFAKSKLRIDLDSFKDYNKQTTRQVLEKKLPNIPLLPFEEKTQLDVHDLRYYLNANDQANFLITFTKVNVDSLTPAMVVELLGIAARRNFIESISVLLDQKTKEDLQGLVEVARIAIQKGHYEILQKLILFDSDLANSLIIDACMELGVAGIRVNKNLLLNQLQCLKLILDQDNVNVRCEDIKGNTPLHYAARSGCTEAMALLLEKGCYIGHMNKFHVPPITDIPLGVLSKYLDSCLRLKKDETNQCMIEFDYQCLMPHVKVCKIDEEDDAKPVNRFQNVETETLRYMADHNGLKQFLKHPLFSSFLYLKWNRIRLFFYIHLILSMTFYLLVNTYIFLKAKNSPNEISNITDVLRIATFIAIICLALYEILQFLSTPLYYIFNFSNWLDMVLILLTTLFFLRDDVEDIQAVIILLSTWRLIFLIGDHPRMSTGIEMFKTVSLTFIKFLFPYVICIIAFALAFSTLFKKNENFVSFDLSLFKTIIMLTGEFDANDLLFTPLGRYIFVIFVFFMAIILLNLLNGLAVSDTAEVLRKAELLSLISRTKLIAYVENIAIGGFNVRGPRFFCCINFSILNLGCNPLYFLLKRILLFPSHIPDGKFCVPLYNHSNSDCAGKCHNTCFDRSNHIKLEMDERIIKQVRDMLCRKEQENDSNRFELVRLYKRLESIESSIDIIKEAIKSNNCNVSIDQQAN